MAEYFKIGKIAATFGLKGEVVLVHSLGKKTSLKGLEAIFIEEVKDSFLPYFVEGGKIKNDDQVYLKLKGFETKEAARVLVQREVWITEDDFKKFAAGAAPISLLGFHLINEAEDLGPILEVYEQPHQVLCRINRNEKEVLIPINEAFLDKIDKKKRQVFVTLPDGLLDL
jgi:16S rRNA processing protein RimM